MKKALKRNVYFTLAALWCGLTLPLSAVTIYDNSIHDLTNRFNPGTLQVGDEIILAGTDRNLTLFSFEYWGTNTAKPDNSSFSATVQARVEFYKNNGPLFNGFATPGTNFFDSGWFDISPTPRSTLVFTEGADFPAGGLLMPVISNMTWSVEFRGMGGSDSVGVDLYSPPVVGQDFPDYWQDNVVGGWTLLTNTVPMDFGARMATPEPSSITLTLLGGLGILILVRRLRRKD